MLSFPSGILRTPVDGVDLSPIILGNLDFAPQTILQKCILHFNHLWRKKLSQTLSRALSCCLQ